MVVESSAIIIITKVALILTMALKRLVTNLPWKISHLIFFKSLGLVLIQIAQKNRLVKELHLHLQSTTVVAKTAFLS